MALVDNTGGAGRVPARTKARSPRADGPAAGVTSVDIGAAGIELDAGGTVAAAQFERRLDRRQLATFGACNADEPTNAEQLRHPQRPHAFRCAAAGGIPGSAVRAAGGCQQPDHSDHLRVDLGDAHHREHRTERRVHGAGRGYRRSCAPPRRTARRARITLPTRVAVAEHHGAIRRQRRVRRAGRRATPATTSSCAIRSTRRRTTRIAARRTGWPTTSTPRISAPRIAATASPSTRRCRRPSRS